MRIADVSAHALSSPINPPQDRSFHGGTRRLLKRDVVLVVVETADGAYGVAPAGATSSSMREYFEGDSQATFADVVESDIADAMEGEIIETPVDAHSVIERTRLPDRLVTRAISALDVALYDLYGKEVGAPVYELLAAEFEDTLAPTTNLPLYASAGMYMEPEGYASQAELLEEAGFIGYKYRPGIGPDGDKETIDRVTATCNEMEVMIDAHTWWKLEHSYGDDVVFDIVRRAAERGVCWVEEPVAPDNYEGYRSLSETSAPLAGGESEESPEGLLALGETGAVSYLQGDVRHHRGFTGCSTVITICRKSNVEFVPHNFGTWLGLLANAHLVAASPEVELVEYPVFEADPLINVSDDPGMYPFDLAFDILEGRPSIENGMLAVPEEPGLGVDIDFDVVEKYPFIEGPWTTFNYNESV